MSVLGYIDSEIDLLQAYVDKMRKQVDVNSSKAMDAFHQLNNYVFGCVVATAYSRLNRNSAIILLGEVLCEKMEKTDPESQEDVRRAQAWLKILMPDIELEAAVKERERNSADVAAGAEHSLSGLV